jgi:hypothetical protein
MATGKGWAGRPDSEILGGVFQANPAYELALYESLPEAEREALEDARKSPDFYGVLRPRTSSWLNVKAINRDAARLFVALGEASGLPAHVRAEPGTARAIAQMVLDGVLTVRHNGRVVSGAAAFEFVFGAAAEVVPANPLAALSLAALQYAQELPVDEPTAMAMRLYRYGCIPRSPAWTLRHPDPVSVWRALGLDTHGDLSAKHAREWRRCDPPAPHDAWLAWESLGSVSRSRGTAAYKLYVSPHPNFLREAIDAAASSCAAAFKVGKDLAGILRPDKLVLYFDGRDRLDEAAASIALRLNGCRAHGVPFTAQLGDSIALSWGSDPPPEEMRPRWIPRESWRLWVVNRLAVALIAAKHANRPSVEPLQFAMARIALEGVNIDTWSPGEIA